VIRGEMKSRQYRYKLVIRAATTVATKYRMGMMGFDSSMGVFLAHVDCDNRASKF